MINILHLRSSNIFSGPEALIQDMLRLHDSRDMQPHLIRINKLVPEETPQLIDAAHRMNIIAESLVYKNRFGLGPLFKVRRFAKMHDIDIFHSHSYRDDILATAVALTIRARKIVTVHRFGWLEKTSWQNYPDVLILKHSANAIITVDGEICEQLAGIGIEEERLHLIHNGVDLDFFRKRDERKLKRQLGYSDEDFVIGMMSRVEVEKNIDVLISIAGDVLKPIPNARFLIVGDGNQLDYLKALARNKGVLGRFNFLGFRQDTEALLQVMDLFCVPSSTEGLPRSLLEALACEKVCITSRAGGMPEAIRDGETGILLDEPSGPCLFDAIERAWKMGADGRTKMGKRARVYTDKHFNVVDMVRRTEDVYRQVMGEPPLRDNR